MIRRTTTLLRVIEHDDPPHFVRWINKPAVHRFMVIRYPLSIAQEENRC